MSAQHRTLAAVWDVLQGNRDVAILLREFLGQNSIDSILREDEPQSINDSIRSIIWVKAIFDLQRCYLSGIATGLAGLPPYHLPCILPSELLFSSILYLINVKSRLFSSQTTLMTKEFTRPRNILAQTVLSGLRLLLLRKENISVHDRRRLQAAINAAWQHDRMYGVEHFIVSELFAAILDSVNEPDHVNPYQAEWANARLPTFATGLYPLDIRPETFVTPLIHGTMEEDWLDAYWVLFDCLWAAECAIVQRYVDIRRHTGIANLDQDTIETDEILEQIYHARTSLIISVFHVTGPMTPPPAMLESLAITLLDWNEDLDSFLSRQDSLLQQRSSQRPSLSRNSSYGKQISEMKPYFEDATIALAEWLSSRKSGYEQFTIQKSGVTVTDMQDMVEKWVKRITASKADAVATEVEGASLPVYVVNCPKLHVMPKKYLEYQLRWADKWAYESIQENSPIVNWKEGVQCPSCPSGEKIKTARLIEPFQDLSTALESAHFDTYSLSHYSVGDSGSGSYDTASASAASRSTSEAESGGISLPSHSPMNMSIPPHVSRVGNISADTQGQSACLPPRYTDSPISPATMGPLSPRSQSYGSIFSDYPVSPLTESLNIPIPLSIGSRLSMDLPIPVQTPTIPESIPENTSSLALSDISSVRGNTPSDMSSILLNTASTNSLYSEISFSKPKSTSRTVRIANSIRRKPAAKEKESSPLPKDPCFAFSSSGHSLLLWSKGANHLIRFDIPSNDTSSIQGCKYEATMIEVAAAGNQKCAVVVSGGVSKKKLLIYDGISLQPEAETELDFSGRLGQVCIAMSKDDKFIATSLNDDIQLYKLDNGLQLLPFHHQIHVYELRGGISHRRTISVGRTTSDESIADNQKTETGSWFGTQSRGLSSKEAAEEQQRNTATLSRQIAFSTDSKRLVVATQLGDHCVYVDVWDCTREPVSTISEHSRSFKLPPWTLNDGDLTGVFYDSTRRAALVTAFLGKEYPVLVPFPGYDTLQNETYSTKIVHAAQSPSGSTFVIANAMTEMIQFEYSPKGNLSPRKLKKSSGKISSSVFKPGSIALAMPLENCVQCFWIKDGKCILRNIKLGTIESFKDIDIRPHYDRLMSLRSRPVIAKAPSLMIPELDAGGFG